MINFRNKYILYFYRINIARQVFKMITVIMTIYDRDQYYKDALDSLANQTKRDFELLIYSNIPVEYDLSKFKDVKVIEDAPVKLTLKYAYGIRKAKHDKICFLEDDDTFTPDKIEYLESINFEYFHNDYNHITTGEHNPGKGFNMSSIAINRKYLPELANALGNQPELGIPDSFIYWFALENRLHITLTDKKLTNYRFRNYKLLQERVLQNLSVQISYLKTANEYFTSSQVKDIIRARLISNIIFQNSYDVKYIKVPLKDMLWLVNQKNIEGKNSKFITYLLTLPMWRNKGIKVIEKFRNKRISKSA